MKELFLNIKNGLSQFTLLDVLDILILALLIYGLVKLTSQTRAIQVLKGLGVVIVLSRICELIGLTAVTWILQYVINAGAVLLVILFQPEIRRALEKLGRGRVFDVTNMLVDDADRSQEIEEIERAVLNMSIRKIGALMVFENKTGLKEIVETGTIVDSKISSQIIENIFFPNSPLHDGAMIIREGKVHAAGCFLPLSDNKQIAAELGTRHRAALGVSEISDAVVIIVSEETGVISSCFEGVITRYHDQSSLHKLLQDILEPSDQSVGRRIKKRKKEEEEKE